MADNRSSGELLRVLGPTFAVAIGLGTVIGGGILRTPATVLDAVPIPWLALCLWGAVGIQSLIEANVLAEVMTMFRQSGGLFVPARAAFGEGGGLLVGWSDWLNYVAACAALALLGADFLAMIFPSLGVHKVPVTSAVLIGFGAYNGLGVKEGEQAQIVGSALKTLFLLGVVALIVVLVPAAPPEPTSVEVAARPLGFASIVLAYTTIFGAYTGWPNSAYFAGEDRDPGHNIPRGMFITILATMALFLLVSVALFHALPVEALRNSKLPVADALSPALGPVALKLVAGGAALIVLTCCNANMMAAPRILYGLARERLLPGVVQRVNKGGTPIFALLLTVAASLGLALTGTFETVFLIMAALAMLPQILAEAAIFRLRRSHPDLPRPWQARLYPWLPALALVVDIALLGAFLVADWRSGLFMAAAVAVVIPVGMMMRRAHGTLGMAR